VGTLTTNLREEKVLTKRRGEKQRGGRSEGEGRKCKYPIKTLTCSEKEKE
jgi:hypothetical protein